MSAIVNSLTVDVTKLPEGKFQPEHLQTISSLVTPDSFPEIFNDLPEGLVVSKEHIQNIDMSLIFDKSSIHVGLQQSSRVAGANKMINEIRSSIFDKGWILRCPPPIVFKRNNGLYLVITGDTRIHITRPVLNSMLCIVIEAESGFDEDSEEVQSGISFLGQYYNTISEPASKPEREDIYQEVCRAIDSGWIDGKYDTIRARVVKMCNNTFAKTKIDTLTNRCYNHSPLSGRTGRILGYTEPLAQKKMKQLMLIDTPKIRYLCRTAKMVPKTFFGILDNLDDDYQYRLVLHCGILDGSLSLEDDYRNAVRKFVEEFNRAIVKQSKYFYGGLPKNYKITRNGCSLTVGNLEIYGVLPAIESLHSLDKLNRDWDFFLGEEEDDDEE